ncbi:MAG: hypothetical protein NTZ17_05605, partial [Phycisphaerae bacterium]|nr:hypothetical protein [Phycisphaerae bacterium]
VLTEDTLRAGRRALVVSLYVIGFLGVLFIYRESRGTGLTTAVERCIGFFAIMGGIHFIGYRLWRRQSANAPANHPAGLSLMFRTFLGLIHGLVGFFVSTFLMVSHLCNRHAPLFEGPFILAVSMACFLCVFNSDRYRSALKGTGLILLIATVVAFIYLTILHL